jgi:transcriptional/translational regulatory protein YebC/TACO1
LERNSQKEKEKDGKRRKKMEREGYGPSGYMLIIIYVL